MSKQLKEIQIVFLIDINQINLLSNTSSYSLANITSLSCFRILHYLSSTVDKQTCSKALRLKRVPLKWGYRFFSSNSYIFKVQQVQFRPFKKRYFEEFENELERRYEEHCNACQSHKSKIQGKLVPTELLNRALTELLGDFPWENPDLSSPVKNKHRRKEFGTGAVSSCRHKNYVALFTPCPKNSKQMKAFTGKRVLDAEIFRDAFMPPSLLDAFQDIKLSLLWIDSDLNVEKMDQVEKSCIQYVQKSLIDLDGGLVPINSLVQSGCPYFIDVTSLSSSERSEESNKSDEELNGSTSFLLPVTSVLDFYINHVKRSSVTSTSVSSFPVSIILGENIICDVTLVPTTVDYENMDTSVDRNSDTKTNLNGIQDNSLDEHSESYILSSFIDSTRREESVLESGNCQLSVFGVLSKWLLPLLTETKRVFVCTIDKQNADKHKSASHFEALLRKLSLQKKILVLSSPSLAGLAVLEPWTVQSAVVSFLPLSATIHLEQAFFSEGPFEEDDQEQLSLEKQEDVLVKRLLKNIDYETVEHNPSPVFERSEKRFDGRVLDRWYLPGGNTTMTGLIGKLNDRISQLNFLSEEEVVTLQQLQKMYRQEKKPPGLRDSSVGPEGNTSVHGDSLTDTQIESTNESVLAAPESIGTNTTSRRSSQAAKTRGKMIVSISKEVVKDKDQVLKEARETRKKSDRLSLGDKVCILDFESEEKLLSYIQDVYKNTLKEETAGMYHSIEKIVNTVFHFMKKPDFNNTQEWAKMFLGNKMIIPATKLREKYAALGDVKIKEKIREYQLQILLHLQTQSCLLNMDQSILEGEEINEEVVSMLRTLSFLVDPAFLSDFMKTYLVDNYCHSLPKTLTNIYDELMQPLPTPLADIVSSISSADQSVFSRSLLSIPADTDSQGPPSTRTRSHDLGSVGQPASQPGSNKPMDITSGNFRTKRSSRLVHHPSLSDFGSKRQIVVEKKVDKSRKVSSSSSNRVRKHKETNKVRKNLFERSKSGAVKLERRQSVTVMERIPKTPKQKRFRSPSQLWRSPRRRLVADTPHHKQVVSSLKVRLSSEDSRPESELTKGQGQDTQVVEESPEKSVSKRKHSNTPTQFKRARALLRRAFYSEGIMKRTRNLTKYFQLADRIAGRQRHSPGGKNSKILLSLNNLSEVSPAGKSSSFLFSQLASSPTPQKTTPGKCMVTPCKASPGESRTRTKLLVQPKQLFSPLSRRMSPRFLVPDSGTKSHQLASPQKTPVKSPICGSISMGLDSPSQNTRSKLTTPTRKSVRAALFAQSPAKPVTRLTSPGKLKNLKDSHEIPKHTEVSQRCSITPQKRRDSNQSCRQSLDLSHFEVSGIECKDLNNYAGLDTSKNNSSTGISFDDHIRSLRTPSSKVKTKVKTPESFDKWPKIKPRYNQSPSSQLKSKRQLMNSQANVLISPKQKKDLETSFKLEANGENFKNQLQEPIFLSPRSLKAHTTDIQGRDTCTAEVSLRNEYQTDSNVPLTHLESILLPSSPLRRKRVLDMSPCKDGSPMKRRCRKLVGRCLDSWQSNVSQASNSSSGMKSKGFDISDTFTQGSTSSQTASLDYFSSQNEMFLPSDIQTEVGTPCFVMTEADMDTERPDRPSAQVGETNWISSAKNTEDHERSSSPVFDLHRRVTYKKSLNHSCSDTIPGVKDIPSDDGISSESTLCTSSVGMIQDKNLNPSYSPTVSTTTSPSESKYSPGVSAKSLMHLINSPLVKSPSENGDGVHTDTNSPGVRRSSRNYSQSQKRSRRSLQLQN
ncbi:hypothetical protein CHS0354_034121 [Potamilus streckersoni]|uniref:Treslin N-terminal domain-containing protein n=1 Tax=Potamilus streckersoni TaxID=2493646 RepID=A0AAE0WC60_9BIVA|nr:hypothetical protein CHS0354_034121 [Potamilus streckersoni]